MKSATVVSPIYMATFENLCPASVHPFTVCQTYSDRPAFPGDDDFDNEVTLQVGVNVMFTCYFMSDQTIQRASPTNVDGCRFDMDESSMRSFHPSPKAEEPPDGQAEADVAFTEFEHNIKPAVKLSANSTSFAINDTPCGPFQAPRLVRKLNGSGCSVPLENGTFASGSQSLWAIPAFISLPGKAKAALAWVATKIALISAVPLRLAP
jgi:hypothetical protein